MLFRAENQQSCERCVHVQFLLCKAVLYWARLISVYFQSANIPKFIEYYAR